ncbi:MAG TPA: hypothetical protein VHR18_00565 [Solirubrobacterales bacterium]|jgi:hypothetical protein|nr:hypothetical protein [Solirubrobacterales bacterium]
MNFNGMSQMNGHSQAPAPQGDQIERRIERAAFETDAHLIVGDVTLPPAGYQSRFSDSLNRGDLEFVPLTNVEVTALRTGEVNKRPFMVLSKSHIRIAYPLDV